MSNRFHASLINCVGIHVGLGLQVSKRVSIKSWPSCLSAPTHVLVGAMNHSMTFCGREIGGSEGTPTVTAANKRRRGQSVSPPRVTPPQNMDELDFAAWDSLELTPVLLWPSPYEVQSIVEISKPRVCMA